MVALILLLNASGLALEWPGLMVLGMSSLRLRVFLHGGAAGFFVHDVFHPSKFYGQHRRSARAQWTKLPVVSHKHTTSGRRLQSHGGRSDLNNY